MKKLQALLGTALTYSIAHRYMDKDPAMREGWGWFALSFSVALAILSAISYWKNSHSDSRAKQRYQTNPGPQVKTDATKEGEMLRQLAAQIVSKKASSFDDALSWDRQLRVLLRDSTDPGVREEAFGVWDVLWQTWIEHCRETGKAREAEELERLVGEFKAKHLDIETAKEFVSSPEFAQLVTGVSGPSR